MKNIIANILSQNGYIIQNSYINDDIGAIATKKYKTINGENEAHIYLSNGDEYNRTLSLNYHSAGKVYCADLIKKDSKKEDIENIVKDFIKNSEIAIDNSYSRRIYLNNVKDILVVKFTDEKDLDKKIKSLSADFQIEFDNNLNIAFIKGTKNSLLEIEEMLIENDIEIIPLENMEVTEKTLTNLKDKFIKHVLENTPYLDTKNLFYMNPMDTWKKSEVKKEISNIKKLQKDFEILDDFMLIKYEDDITTSRLIHNMQIDYDCNNFRGVSGYIEEFEEKIINSEKLLNSIKNELNALQETDIDEIKQLVGSYEKNEPVKLKHP